MRKCILSDIFCNMHITEKHFKELLIKAYEAGWHGVPDLAENYAETVLTEFFKTEEKQDSVSNYTVFSNQQAPQVTYAVSSSQQASQEDSVYSVDGVYSVGSNDVYSIASQEVHIPVDDGNHRFITLDAQGWTVVDSNMP